MRSVGFFPILAAMAIALTPSVFAQEKNKPEGDPKPAQPDKPKPKVEPTDKPDKPAQPPVEKPKVTPKKNEAEPKEKPDKPAQPTKEKPKVKAEPKDKTETGKPGELANKVASSPEMRYFDARFKLMSGEVEAMKEAYELQRKKIDALTTELKLLRQANQQLAIQAKLQYATRQDIDAINTRIEQVDKNRKQDRDLILAEFTKLNRKLGKLASIRQTPVAPVAPPEPSEKFIEHPVKKGEFLSAIIVAYNEHLKENGFKTVSMRDILNANPRLKPERILVGQVIRIPRRK
jgi:hypothetical protein